MSSLGLLALAALPLLSQLAHAQSCAPIDNVKLTFYGYPDGPGDTTSFGCSGSTPVQSTSQNPPTAGGSGSYEDPFTLATMAGSSNLQECEMVYIPYLKKYFRYQDHCSGCDSNHIDLWIGTDTNGGAAQISCEDTLGTSSQTVIKNPPNGLDVDAQNLWDGSCHPDSVFTNAATSNLCSGGSGGSNGGSPSSAAALGPSSSAAGPAPVVTPPVQPIIPPPQQPTSISTSVAAPGGQVPYQGPPKGYQKEVVRPTTLLTVAGTPVSTNEPTGTPPAIMNGVCTTPGATVCSVDGLHIGTCKPDMTVVLTKVADGDKCVNGWMVSANS